MKKFNMWIFHLILGRIPPENISEAEVEKHYYILPIKDGDSSLRPLSLIDWDVADDALESGLVYRRYIACAAVRDLLKASVEEKDFCICGETLKMFNGEFIQEELLDTFVTSMCKGVPCYVTSTSTGRTGSNLSLTEIQRSMSYTNYYSQKHSYELEYKDQQLLEACKLLRAVSFLGCHQNRDAASGVRNFNMTRMLLPPEICLVHRRLRGKLYRGAIRLPSVLYNLEMSLLAAELRDKVDIPISYSKILEALTSGACTLDASYEKYELLGDSFLKLTGATQAFFEDQSMDAERLGALLHGRVCNKALFQAASSCGLFGYIQAEIFVPRKWNAPGLTFTNEKSNKFCSTPPKPANNKQLLSYKTLADVLEALIGCCVINGNLQVALKMMTWLKVSIHYPPRIYESFLDEFLTNFGKSDLPTLGTDIQNLSQKLEYPFNNTNLLAAALTANLENTVVFQRLEFLGDAVLDYLVTRHIVASYSHLSLLELNNLKQATINREHLSCLAVRHGLHKFLQGLSPDVTNQISRFEKSLIKEGFEGKFATDFGIARQTSPKVLGDVVQTLAAAIFIDSKLDVELAWKVCKPLFEPLATPETVSLHPTKQLQLFCDEKGWTLEWQCVPCDGTVQVNVVVNSVVVGSSQNEDKRVARRLAAMKGLQCLYEGASNCQVFPEAVSV